MKIQLLINDATRNFSMMLQELKTSKAETKWTN